MDYPLPGMDPYLEHPVPWEGAHARLIVAIANQLQPQIDPRYIASIEERVYIEGPVAFDPWSFATAALMPRHEKISLTST